MNPAYAIPFDPFLASPGMTLLLGKGNPVTDNLGVTPGIVGLTFDGASMVFRGGAYLYLGQARVSVDDFHPILAGGRYIAAFAPSMVQIPLDHYLNQQAILSKVALALGLQPGFDTVRLVARHPIPVEPVFEYRKVQTQKQYILEATYNEDYRASNETYPGVKSVNFSLLPARDRVVLACSWLEALSALTSRAISHVRVNNAG